MHDIHEPGPEFTRFMEWQTRTELRRRDRFESPSFTSRRSTLQATGRVARVTRIAALVLVSLFCGAGVVIAAERIQDSRQLEILLERNGLLLELTERRVAAAVDIQDRERLLHEQGMVSETGMMRAGSRVVALERDRDHLRLDRAEMETSRRDVDDRLSAQPVGPRDFVSEHLRVDKASLGGVRELRARQEAIALAQYEAGMRVQSDLIEAAHATASAGEDIARIDERLALRADFLLGRIEAFECESRDLVGDAEFRRTRLAGEAARIATLLERAQQIEAAGRGSGDALRLRGERDAIEVELLLIDLELELLR